jgi:hypothetical protein
MSTQKGRIEKLESEVHESMQNLERSFKESLEWSLKESIAQTVKEAFDTFAKHQGESSRYPEKRKEGWYIALFHGIYI